MRQQEDDVLVRWLVRFVVAAGVLGDVLLTPGCGYVLKGAGEYPGYVECRGKGSVTGVGQTSLSAGIGGAGQNSFTLTVDCGDGLIYQQGKEPPATAGSVVPPSLPPKPAQ